MPMPLVPGFSPVGRDENSVSKHFVAVSNNAAEVAKFVLMPRTYSSSGTGSAGAIPWLRRWAIYDAAIGPENFRAMLDGFRQMDTHFMATPFEQPAVLMAARCLVQQLLWRRDDCSLAIRRYLNRFTAYLQQLTMESNGKHVTLIGTEVTQATSPIYWVNQALTASTRYQLIHQGTRLIPCDFIAFERPLNPLGCQHDMLLANVFDRLRR